MEQRIGQAVSLEELKVPAVLYKYRDYGNIYHRRAMFSSEIYIPSANEFNDPFDSKIPFRYRDEDLTEENIFLKCLEVAKRKQKGLNESQYHEMAFENQKKHLLNDDKHLEDFDRQFYDRICWKSGIFCLTPNSENFLMWSYYSNSHKGFCIGYDSAKLLHAGLFILGGIVDYKNSFPKIPMFDNNDVKLFWDIYYTKWRIWEHENEYRLIHEYKYEKRGRKDVFALEIDVIAEIVFGCEFPQSETNVIYKTLIEKYPHIKLSQIKLKKEEFKTLLSGKNQHS